LVWRHGTGLAFSPPVFHIGGIERDTKHSTHTPHLD
jgi:hypothetical protein